MKILLINPPNFNEIKETLPFFVEQEKGITPPLGLLYVAAYIQKHTSHSIQVLDCQAEKTNYPSLERKIKEINPDVVGITALSMAIKDVAQTINLVKKTKSDCMVVIGGPHAACYPKETIQWPGVDYVIYGEGEKPFTQLLNNLNNPSEFQNIPGLVYRQNNQIIDNGQSEPIHNLDELPFPDRKLINCQSYQVLTSGNAPVTSIFTSRGCPFGCRFCDRPTFGKTFRTRSAENVFQEIKECIALGIKNFLIYDDTFTVDKKRAIEICQKIIQERLKISFSIRTRVDTVNPELLRYLKKAGCSHIHYGIESGSEKILKVINKGINLKQIQDALDWTRKEKIQSLTYFMIGNPEENREDIKQTLKLVESVKTNYAMISVFTPFPKTIFYQKGIEENIFPDLWAEFARNPQMNFQMPTWNEYFSKKELHQFMMTGYRNFYLKPRIILQEILNIKSFNELINKIRIGLKML